MIHRRIAGLLATVAIVFAACSNAATASPSAASVAPPSTAASPSAAGSPSAAAAACTVGVSWNNYDQERWKKADEPAIKKAIADGGGTYTSTDARDSSEQQLKDVDTLINKGVKVIIMLAKDATAIKPAIAKAEAAGITVIGYDRLIEDPKALYITFDNKKVGTIMAQVITKLVPKGNYAIIKGDPGDANAKFLRDGMDEGGLKALVDSGAIKIVVRAEHPELGHHGRQERDAGGAQRGERTRSTRSSPRMTAWRPASWPLSRPSA